MAFSGPSLQPAPLTATVIFESESFREPLRAALTVAGVEVINETRLSELDPQALAQLRTRVLLVNLEPAMVKRSEALSAILDNFSGTLIFNDADATAALADSDRPRWIRHLASKISDQIDVLPPRPTHRLEQPPAAPAVQPNAADFDIWFLVASIGGPEAMRSFLPELAPNSSVAFVLVQHIGPEFIDQMIGQLDQLTPMPVRIARHGQRLEPNKIYVVPSDKQTRINAQRCFQMSRLPAASTYTPSIDQVLGDAVDRLGAGTNAVVFSGMANDGICAATKLIECGGEVWVQAPESCVVSSIVDGIIKHGGHGLIAPPAELGQALQQRINESQE